MYWGTPIDGAVCQWHTASADRSVVRRSIWKFRHVRCISFLVTGPKAIYQHNSHTFGKGNVDPAFDRLGRRLLSACWALFKNIIKIIL